jgi:hypothetical protein
MEERMVRMRKRARIVLLLILCVVVFISFINWSSNVLADAQNPNRPQVDLSPVPEGLADQFLVSQNPQKSIEIHRSGVTPTSDNQGLYFHKPVLALDNGSNSVDGLPLDIIALHQEDSITWVTIRVIISSPELRQKIAGWVVEHDPQLRDVANVRVLAWPIIALRVTAKKRFRSTPLATRLTDRLNQYQDTVEVDIPFSASDYQTFKKSISDVYFYIEYSYENVTDSYARLSQNLATQVNAALANALQSTQLTTNQVITQDERDTLISKISGSIVGSIDSNNVDMAKQLLNTATSSSLLNAYLPSQKLDFPIGDADLRKKLYDHLTPLVQTAAQQWSQTHSETDTTGVKVDVGLSAGPVKIDPSVSDQIQKTSGVQFQKNEATQVYAPFSATVYTIQNITQATTLNYAQNVVIEQAGISDFVGDGPSLISFTSDKLNVNLKQSAAIPFDGITPGMAFCFLGKDLPDGFFELDGNVLWPDANWVPDALRGKKTSSAQGRLIGVASTVDDVGKISGAGSLQVPPSAFPKITGTSVLGISPSSTLLKRIDGGYGGDNPFASQSAFGPGSGDWGKYAGNVNWNMGFAANPNPELLYQIGSYNQFSGDHIAQPYIGNLATVYTMSSDQIGTAWPMPSSANPPNLQCRWIVRK